MLEVKYDADFKNLIYSNRDVYEKDKSATTCRYDNS
jgi:hypothetical protein